MLFGRKTEVQRRGLCLLHRCEMLVVDDVVLCTVVFGAIVHANVREKRRQML